MKNTLLKPSYHIIILLILFTSCTKEHKENNDFVNYYTSKTENKVLVGSGIDTYYYLPISSNTLKISYTYPNSSDRVSLSLKEDTLLRISNINIEYKNKTISMSIDYRKFTFQIRTSEGFFKQLQFKTKEIHNVTEDGWYDLSQQKIIEPNWYLNSKIDYRYAFQSLYLLQEAVRRKQFISPISLIKEREAEISLKVKLGLLSNYKKENNLTISNSGPKCEQNCQTGLYYNWWRTQACEEAYNNIASACSNSLCIGDCGTRSCDCFTSPFGDFLVICRAFSKGCGDSAPIDTIE